MALQSSGQISLKNIRDFFKGPGKFKAFYRNGSYVGSYSPQNDLISVINSGNDLSIKDFYGAVRPIPGVSIGSNTVLASGNVPAGAVLTASGIPTTGTNTIQWIRGFSVVQNGGTQYTVNTADEGSSIYITVQNNEYDFQATSNAIGVAKGYPGSKNDITTYGTFTVPLYVTSLTFDISGGGGGGGGHDINGNDTKKGGKGGNAGRLTGSIPVKPGDTITVRIGESGDGGTRAKDGNPLGGTANGSMYPGGNGGRPGESGQSGQGGGAGGATVVYKNTSETSGIVNFNRANPSIVLVAGGGGGGGGAGQNSAGGSGNAGTGQSGANGAGKDVEGYTGSGGGGGGGGGGRQSGKAGISGGGDNGGTGGNRGDNYAASGISITTDKSDGSAGGAGSSGSSGASGTKGYAKFSWTAYY